jgi:sirohydrochlorin cobaltochelatase
LNRLDAIERALEAALTDRLTFGQVLIRKTNKGVFVLSHRDDETLSGLRISRNPEDAAEIARCDDAGHYRPLKTAPNLRHGWCLEIATMEEARRALDYFYPGRLAVFAAGKSDQLQKTPLRETLDRQTGMYRVAARISDEQIDELVGEFCRSDGGCLRTILWKRDSSGALPSTKLPAEKFDPKYDQTGCSEHCVPLLCQEACNLLVAQARKVVKMEGAAPSAP